jgi:hypothetical protein
MVRNRVSVIGVGVSGCIININSKGRWGTSSTK